MLWTWNQSSAGLSPFASLDAQHGQGWLVKHSVNSQIQWDLKTSCSTAYPQGLQGAGLMLNALLEKDDTFLQHPVAAAAITFFFFKQCNCSNGGFPFIFSPKWISYVIECVNKCLNWNQDPFEVLFLYDYRGYYSLYSSQQGKWKGCV